MFHTRRIIRRLIQNILQNFLHYQTIRTGFSTPGSEEEIFLDLFILKSVDFNCFARFG